MSGAEIGVGAVMLRAILSIGEPYYAAGMWVRNKMFDTGIRKQHRLGRPVISVGNVTTGGTGKTPVVQWVVRRLISMQHRPGILLRGYKSGNSRNSDEADLLARSLDVVVRANPNRVAGATELLHEHPEIDVIVLDDGFQHRKVARDLDLVLIDATNPFGYGHILPRGMLREPMTGLSRADAFIITRAEQINAEGIAQIEKTLRRYKGGAPIFHANHAIVGFKCGDEILASGALDGKKIVAFCGIGNPNTFHRQLLDLGAIDGGLIALDDHHAYSAEEIQKLNERAVAVGAEMLVTTEKDWVKIERLAAKSQLPIWRAELKVQLADEEADRLIEMIAAIMGNRSSD